MATVFENVFLCLFSQNGKLDKNSDSPSRIELECEQSKAEVRVLNGSQLLHNIHVNTDTSVTGAGDFSVVLCSEKSTAFLKFPTSKDANFFKIKLKEVKDDGDSCFKQRTDQASAEQYFQFYGYLSQQQNMMQDYIRTSSYQRAMLDNTLDFQKKVVLDVGAGSGILSFFAIQAGARKVYAIEASSMAEHCGTLVSENKLAGKIEVIAGKIEEVELPEKVDVIISEPMGYMLFNERMLETFLHAKKWLKRGGKVFPTQGDLHITPFTDDSLYMEQFTKANFWYQPSFHGIDLSSLRDAAVKEYFKQPVVDTFDMRICLARSQKYTVDFRTAHETDLQNIEIPLSFLMLQSGTVHGLAFWFDVAFIGSQSTVWLSTAPTQPLTHWYQVRCLIEEPIFVKQGQSLLGKVHLRANKRQSYDVDIELYSPGTDTSSSNTLDLKNPYFRYTGQQPTAPPGTMHTSPSDMYWNQQEVADLQDRGLCLTLPGNLPASEAATVQGNSFVVSNLLNGGMGDGHMAQAHVGGVVQNNLVPLANVTPVNPGSIPAATVVSANSAASQAIQTRTSIGAGISPAMFGQSTANSQAYQISNQFMIGDYVVPGNLLIVKSPNENKFV